jgi:hypothetical protein
MEVVIGPQLRGQRYSVAVILRALVARIKIQSTSLLVVIHLHDPGLAILEGLRQPMEFEPNREEGVLYLDAGLSCFHNTQSITKS